MNRRAFLLGAVGLAAGVFAGTGVLARTAPPLEEQRLFLDAGLVLDPPLRVSLVSDLHAGFFLDQGQLEAAVHSIRAFGPDLILNAGDTVDRDPNAVGEVGWFLAQLASTAPLFCVLGNHDLWVDPRKLVKRIEAAGARVLRNELALLDVRGRRIAVCGARDLMEESGPHASALWEVPPDAFSILLAHNPETLFEVAGSWSMGLMACGHSHGGQVCLPGRVPIYNKVDRAFLPGLSSVRGRNVALTRGMGFAALPLRVNCPPDVTHIEVL